MFEKQTKASLDVKEIFEGIDNSLISPEIGKLFSEQMATAPKELHRLGAVQQLKVGSSTGMRPEACRDIKEFGGRGNLGEDG